MAILKILKNKKTDKTPLKGKKPKAEPTSVTKQSKPSVKTDNIKIPSYDVERPWISEKAAIMSSINQYAFKVRGNANKNSVKKEIEARYGVRVKSVNIINRPAKTKRFGYQVGETVRVKKAIVTLRPGEKIEII